MLLVQIDHIMYLDTGHSLIKAEQREYRKINK